MFTKTASDIMSSQFIMCCSQTLLWCM